MSFQPLNPPGAERNTHGRNRNTKLFSVSNLIEALRPGAVFGYLRTTITTVKDLALVMIMIINKNKNVLAQTL